MSAKKPTDFNDLKNLAGTEAVKRPIDAAVLAVKAKATGREQSRLITTCAASVNPEPVRWFWPGRIARGKLTLIAGDPGLGKSMLTANLAAHCSTGAAFPDGGACPLGDVLFASAEDDPADTIRPRLDAAKADPTRVHIVSGIESFTARGDVERRLLSLRHDVEAIREAALDLPECRLIVIDPVSAYLGGLDGHNNAEVRALLAPLADLGRDVGAAIVAVTHLNKGSGGQALYRATGSLAFVAAARAAWAVARDKTDAERRLFLPMKNNIGKDTSGLSYRIAEDNGVPYVVWDKAPVSTSIDEALSAGAEFDHEASITDEAADWLRDVLSQQSMSQKQIVTAANNGPGFKQRTLERAKQKLGIKSKKVGAGKDSCWVWELPAGMHPDQSAIHFDGEEDGNE